MKATGGPTREPSSMLVVMTQRIFVVDFPNGAGFKTDPQPAACHRVLSTTKVSGVTHLTYEGRGTSFPLPPWLLVPPFSWEERPGHPTRQPPKSAASLRQGGCSQRRALFSGLSCPVRRGVPRPAINVGQDAVASSPKSSPASPLPGSSLYPTPCCVGRTRSRRRRHGDDDQVSAL